MLDAQCRSGEALVGSTYFGYHDEFPEATNSFLIGHHTIRLNPSLTSIYCRGSIACDPQGLDKKGKLSGLRIVDFVPMTLLA